MIELPLRRHTPFYIAAGVGVVVFAAGSWLAPAIAVEAAADLFFGTYLVLTLVGVAHMSADYLRGHAASADEPTWIILAVTLGAIVLAVSSLFLVLNAKSAPPTAELVLALASVPLGWLTIHMMAALHYAHIYWRPQDDPRHGKSATPRGGLDFPDETKPDAYDFLYYAYVIGMTAQTSDVGLTTGQMRRITLLHSIVSFFFNTVIVAAAVNAAVSLGH